MQILSLLFLLTGSSFRKPDLGGSTSGICQENGESVWLSWGGLGRAEQGLRAPGPGLGIRMGKQSALNRRGQGRMSFWWAGPNHQGTAAGQGGAGGKKLNSYRFSWVDSGELVVISRENLRKNSGKPESITVTVLVSTFRIQPLHTINSTYALSCSLTSLSISARSLHPFTWFLPPQILVLLNATAFSFFSSTYIYWVLSIMANIAFNTRDTNCSQLFCGIYMARWPLSSLEWCLLGNSSAWPWDFLSCILRTNHHLVGLSLEDKTRSIIVTKTQIREGWLNYKSHPTEDWSSSYPTLVLAQKQNRARPVGGGISGLIWEMLEMTQS